MCFASNNMTPPAKWKPEKADEGMSLQEHLDAKARQKFNDDATDQVARKPRKA